MPTSTRYAHATLMSMVAAEMRNQGMSRIKASHLANFTQCDQISGYIPDATAFAGNAFVIAEAESQEGLSDAHTISQWKIFHTHANNVGGHFVAAVNKADEAAARTLLTQVCKNAANAHLWVF